MKRRSNLAVWLGFFVVLAAMLTVPFFAMIPMTRDFAWLNLVLFFAGGVLLAVGLRRAFRQPELYRGGIAGSILAGVSVLAFGIFIFGIFFAARVPSSSGTPQIGQKAPDFTLPDQTGKQISLADLIGIAAPSTGTADGKLKGLLLVFYRGVW